MRFDLIFRILIFHFHIIEEHESSNSTTIIQTDTQPPLTKDSMNETNLRIRPPAFHQTLVRRKHLSSTSNSSSSLSDNSSISNRVYTAQGAEKHRFPCTASRSTWKRAEINFTLYDSFDWNRFARWRNAADVSEPLSAVKKYLRI